MYAVIRTGGKQYRVAPGDVIRVETQGTGTDGPVEFSDVLAVSGGEGQIGKPAEARVVGEIVEQGRSPKILVFHYKRKKQYKKLRGHRQSLHRGAHHRNRIRRAEVHRARASQEAAEAEKSRG